jgi:hypothetical protein
MELKEMATPQKRPLLYANSFNSLKFFKICKRIEVNVKTLSVAFSMHTDYMP